MPDSIKIRREGEDPETGGSAVTLEVAYGGKGKATILLKPGRSIEERDLRGELEALADALKSANISK
jgi:hypothetical protein